MAQPENLESVLSVLSTTRDLFDFVPSKKKLLGTVHIPMADIGNYHVKEKDEIVLVECSDDKEHGQIPVPKKTFHIKSILADPECNLEVIKDGQFQYINNPFVAVEYVNYNAMVDWENVFSSTGEFLGTIRGGQFYDKFGELVGTTQAQLMKNEKAKAGSVFTSPIPYKIADGFILVNKSHIGSQMRLQWEYVVDDENGFPLIDERTKTAIAFYMHYLVQMNKYFNQVVPKQVMDAAYQLYSEKASAARSSYRINENMQAKILNIMKSFQEHSYDIEIDESI